MDDYKIIIEQDDQTVMAHYEVPPRAAEGYQSEAALERDFIQQLMSQGYDYARSVKDEASLLANLRRQLETDGDQSPEGLPEEVPGHHGADRERHHRESFSRHD